MLFSWRSQQSKDILGAVCKWAKKKASMNQANNSSSNSNAKNKNKLYWNGWCLCKWKRDHKDNHMHTHTNKKTTPKIIMHVSLSLIQHHASNVISHAIPFSIYDLFVAYLMASLNIFRFSKWKCREYSHTTLAAPVLCRLVYKFVFQLPPIVRTNFEIFSLRLLLLFAFYCHANSVPFVRFFCLSMSVYGTLTLHLFYY